MKITRKWIFWIFQAVILFTSCMHHKGPVLSDISISGKISNAANKVIHLSELDVNKVKAIDSATLDEDGKFRFTIKPAGSMFLLISIKPDQQIILVADPGEDIHMNGNARELISTTGVTGSPASLLLLGFEKYTRINQRKVDSLGQVFLNSRSDPDFVIVRQQLDSTYQAIAKDQRKYMERFIDEHSGSLASLIVLNRNFGPKPVFDKKKDMQYFKKIDSGLMATYPGNKNVIDHYSRVKAMIALQSKEISTDSLLTPGMPAPDLRLNNEEGIPMALSSLKGKIVLVYFWAAIDAPSRKYIRQLIPIYKANRKNGFEIFGVALEPNRALWFNAVKLDKPGGVQVNAGNDLNSPEAELFGVKNLPYALLIARDGKILKRDVKLDELKKQLPDFLKK
ncbi:MAG: thioredoxin-like domain-containing protein [Bacteroidales bacterium]